MSSANVSGVPELVPVTPPVSFAPQKRQHLRFVAFLPSKAENWAIVSIVMQFTSISSVFRRVKHKFYNISKNIDNFLLKSYNRYNLTVFYISGKFLFSEGLLHYEMDIGKRPKGLIFVVF